MKLINNITKVVAVLIALSLLVGLVITAVQGNLMGALWYAVLTMLAVNMSRIAINEDRK